MRILLPLLFCLRAGAEVCEDVGKSRIPHATVELAETITTGSFSPPSGAPLPDLPPFCRVSVIARPSSDSEIRIELWMPEKNWNGRLQGTGNGGFAGRIAYGALASGLKLGYAVANTDMGMAAPAKSDASIFVNRPERWADWGYRATHQMTVVAKRLVNAYYGRPVNRAYFVGCSTGGQQALMEAERFPDDYDGIVGGAPAQNRTGVHMSILWNFAVVERDPAAYVPPAKLPLLSSAVLAACDEMDGVKDGVISDPSRCAFDPGSLQCVGEDAAGCLTAPQVETVRRLYAGPVNRRTGERIYAGLPRGSEFGWERLGPRPEAAGEPPFAPIFKWVFGPQWNWRSFDFDRSAADFQKKLAKRVNATSIDLGGFRKRGGRLILYHGWADWLVAPGETIWYYDQVAAHDRLSSVDTADSLRLFMVPGMAHCGGGPGADQFDALSAMVRWVEGGEPPKTLVATKFSNGTPVFRRLLCPFPQVSVYRQPGDPGDNGAYACVSDSLAKSSPSK